METKFIKNPHNNKAWQELKRQGHNPRHYMYMFSKSETEHLFKHIETRQYITIIVKEELEK